jgi:hypothetical protein
MWNLTEFEIYAFGFLLFTIITTIVWIKFQSITRHEKQNIIVSNNMKLTLIIAILSLFCLLIVSFYLRYMWLSVQEVEYYIGYLFFLFFFFLFFIPWIHFIKNRHNIKDSLYKTLNNFGLYLSLIWGITFILYLVGYFNN